MERPLWREDRSDIHHLSGQQLSGHKGYIFSSSYKFTLCTRPHITPGFGKQIMPYLINIRYNGSLVIWKVISLTGAKFKPLMHGFALSYDAKPSTSTGFIEAESESELLCNWRSVSQSVMVLSPSETHDQILAVLKTVPVLYSRTGGRVCLVTGHSLCLCW